MRLYEILKKYPDLHIEITYKPNREAYIITLKSGPYEHKYIEPRDVLEYFNGAVYFNLAQDFFKRHNMEVKQK